MHTTTRRIVSLISAFALLVTCTIAGLVLPTVAEEPTDVVYSQDFQDGAANWTFDDKALETTEDPADATNQMMVITGRDKNLMSPRVATPMTTSDCYIVRFKAKTVDGTKTRVVVPFYNKTNGGYQSGFFDIVTTNWRWYQISFVPQVAASGIEFGFYLDSGSTADTLYIDDVQLVKVDENTNFAPGGDMEGAETQLLSDFYAFGATVEEDTIEAGNKVLHVPTGSSGLWFSMINTKQTNKMYEVSFRYRGGAIKHWFSSSHSALYQNVGSTGASATWKQFKAYIHGKSTNVNNHLMIRTDNNTALSGSHDVWLDDIVVREIKGIALEDAEVAPGVNITLTPTIAPEDAAITTYTWASDAEGVATVANGVVTGVAEGTATITATAGHLSASCTVTVKKPDATGISLNKTEILNLKVGSTDTLEVSVLPEGAELKDAVVWSSNKENVATVADGVVTAVGKGEAVITATAGSFTASCTVTTTDNMLPNGDIEQGKVKPWTDGTWQFETVDGNTMLKIPAGTAYNKAIYWKGMAALDWEVGYYLVSFDVKGDGTRFMTANTTNISTTTVDTLTHTDATNADCWTRYYTVMQLKEGYTINSDWAFHFKTYRSDGAASVIDTYIDNVSITKLDTAAYQKAEEDFDGPVRDGYIYKGMMVEIGKNTGATIVADPDNADNKVLMIPQTASAKDARFKFQHPGNAYFDLTGLFKYTIRYKGAFTDLEAGNADYLSTKRTTENGWTTLEKIVDLKSNASNDLAWSFGIRTSTTAPIYIDYVSLEETASASGIELDVTESTMEIGDTLKLTASAVPEGFFLKDTVVWSSNNSAVATVEEGVVTAVGAGEAIITATAGTLTATCAITVNRPKATAIVLNQTVASLRVGETVTLTATQEPAGSVFEPVVWSTDAASVATVTDGIVTAQGEGTANITATSGTLTATCVVTVKAAAAFVHPNGDFEDGDVSGFVNGKTPVPVLTDENGNHYIQIPANGGLITGPVIDYTVPKDAYFRVSFKVRKTASAKMRFGVNLYSVFDGYARPDWTMEDSVATSGNGEWFQYTAYGKSNYTTSSFSLGFLEIAGNTTADTPLDLDDIEIELLTDVTSEYELNKFYGGDFENGNIASLNDYGFGGLFNDGGVITEDPDEATNHVLHMTKNAQAYFLPSMFTTNKVYSTMRTNSYYKLTYRQKGTGTTSPGITGSYGTRVALMGAPDKASSEWKTITAYYATGASMNSNYCFDFKTTGDVYLDDFELYQIPEATAFALSAETTTLTVGDTQELILTATPANGFVGTLTWSSDNASVATVENGVVTAVAEGTATITVTNGTLSASIEITAEKVMATELILNKGALFLMPGTNETLTFTVDPVGGWHDTVVWTSSDETVATVSDGLVTAVSHGTATIVATAGDLTATCVVEVPKDLVTGGDFEEGRIGTFANVGADSTKNWYIAEGEGFGGGNALAINYKKSDRLLKWPTFVPNTMYEMSFVAKGPQILLQCWKYSGSASNWNTIYTTDIGGGWTQYRVTFTTSANGWGPSTESGYAAYGFIMNRSATLEDTSAITYVDNFSIIPTDKSGERIYGGDFEVPGPQQWSNHLAIADAGVVTEANGNKAYYFPASATKLGDKFLKALDLKKSTDYILTFRAKGDPIDLYINPDYFAGGSASVGWKQTKATDEYTSYAYTFTTKTDLNRNYLLNFTRAQTGAYGLENGIGTWIDNVSLREVSVDLVAEEFFVFGGNTEVKPGSELTFGVKLTNKGNNAVVDSFPVEFRVNGSVFTTVVFEGTILANETTTVLADKVWTATAGAYNVSAYINSDLSVIESNVFNNDLCQELRVSENKVTAPSYAVNAGFGDLVFSDEFDSIDTIDTKGTGKAGYKWYVTRPYGASTLTTDDYKVENGILTLQETIPTYNYGLATMDIKTGNGFTFNKGYLEVKFRIPRPRKNKDGESGVPAIWSLPIEKLRGKSNHWVEMDWMEYWGINAFNKYYPKGFYTISMHEKELNADGTIKYQVKNNNYGLKGLGDSAWHVMGWLWEENQITAYLDGTKVFTQKYSADSKGTPTVSKVEGTVPNGVYTALNEQIMPLIISGSKDNPMEVDYVRIWQDVEEETRDIAYADVAVDGGEIDINEVGALDDAVTKGDTVTINTKPADGYIMKPGSLKYITEDGKEVKILNQSLTDFTFGGGDGHSFEFHMPQGVTKVTAEFVSADETDFAMDTIGTSIYDTGEGNYDGIRFLSRMNMATKFDDTANSLFVKYQGVSYEVMEIGSLLIRQADNAVLDLNNYKWRSKAYVKGRDMSLVDYTDSYIDFTVIMKKGASISYESFYARKYMSRGYIVLKDAEGNERTVLSDTILTNSVNGAVAAAN